MLAADETRYSKTKFVPFVCCAEISEISQNEISDIKAEKMKKFGSNPYSNSQSLVSQKVKVSEERIDADIFGSAFSYTISSLILALSHLLVFFTLPFSIWFCCKNLLQWERVVIYRLGKLQGVKGPGSIFTIPWLDNCTRLDLRTKVIGYPAKQVRLSFCYHNTVK